MLKNAIRIIGGEWRSRHVYFPSNLSIKPTPDRVRETLFNWLAPEIDGRYCLDLFAGSGALGFEALSRGAAWVGFIERSYSISKALNQQINQLKASNKAYVYNQSYHQIYEKQLFNHMQEKKLIDLVFIDPPFRKEMIEASLLWLSNQTFLSPHALYYLEYESNSGISDALLKSWQPLKQKQAGQLEYGLWIKRAASDN